MDDMLNEIAAAEDKARTIKSNAVERAGKIIEEARLAAGNSERLAQEERDKLTYDILEHAKVDAQAQYDAAIAESKKQASSYADSAKKSAELAVSKIVGRVISGNS
jgi:vacuolar-type H+-ATPase subunit H